MEITIMGYIVYILGIYWGYIGIMEKKMEATIMVVPLLVLGGFGLQHLNLYLQAQGLHM